VTYPDSVQFLYALGNEIKTAKFGLERIRAVLEALGRPQDRCRFVHVAGTNGKGSTCAMIESGLRAAGRRTGLFTSPHLSEPTERIRIDGKPVTTERFTRAFQAVHETVERLLEEGAIDFHTTYFETVTAMALVIFAEEQLDAIVWEVGLGGRLDATNVVWPELCVITPVDFDHEAFLGKSLESIAAEKAGILKEGVPAIFAPQREEAARVIRQRAAALNAPVTWVHEHPIHGVASDARGSSFTLCQMQIRCPLAGEHQVTNAATAALVLQQLGVKRPAIEAGIASTEWPGRLEHVADHPEIILDGAHNPAGARALASYIQRFYGDRRVRLIFGTMRDKSVDEISGVLFPLAQEVIVTAPRQARALAPEAIRALADHPNLRTAAHIEEALALVRERTAAADAVFVTGSLFLVAEARAILKT
jgi:dihydrofolate synthase/folylpolyglutamate synthase